MNKLERTTLFSINTDVVYSWVGNEIFILPPGENYADCLSPVASNIFSLADPGPTNLDEIETYIKKKYSLNESDAMSDVSQLIESMIKKNFLTVC